MATPQLLGVGIGLVTLSLLLLFAYLQGSHETKSVHSPPSIASSMEANSVLTSSLSMIIHASVDEVFAVLVNYKDYSWSSNTKYTWDDENPRVGSNGTITVSNKMGIRTFTHLIFSLLVVRDAEKYLHE